MPLTCLQFGRVELVLFRADTLPAGVKSFIGRGLVEHNLAQGRITRATKAVVVHGAGNTVRAVKSAVDELCLGIRVVAVIYAETSQWVQTALKAEAIEVVAEAPRNEGRAGRLEIVAELCRQDGFVALEQHEEPEIIRIQHDTIGRSIVSRLGSAPTHVIAGAGTGGTLFGLGAAAKSANPNIRIIGVEGLGSTLTLWRAYLGASGFKAQKAAIEGALAKYRDAGMITSLVCRPEADTSDWFQIDVDFPDDWVGTVGIEGLGVGNPSRLIMDNLLSVDEIQIVTDGQVAEGVRALESHGIRAVQSAGANFFAAMRLVEDLNRRGEFGTIVTVVTAARP